MSFEICVFATRDTAIPHTIRTAKNNVVRVMAQCGGFTLLSVLGFDGNKVPKRIEVTVLWGASCGLAPITCSVCGPALGFGEEAGAHLIGWCFFAGGNALEDYRKCHNEVGMRWPGSADSDARISIVG